MPTPWHYTTFLDFLDHWQTLIAGVLAIMAAFIGAYFVNEQIRESRRQEEGRIARRRLAARAVLPLSLNHLCTYERDNASALSVFYGANRQHLTDTLHFPVLPSDVVPDLQAMIEADGADVAKKISVLLWKLQVQVARIEPFTETTEAVRSHSNRHLIEDYLIDAAELYARAVALLEFAREETATVAPITADSLTVSLRSLGFQRGEFETLHARAIREISRLDQ